ncbi:MAG: hypothetical protein LBG58_02650 [Planctomycetaceae bacterium]|nr:hypothetical protein [Planctomycetaceae bacterium]
MPLQGVDFLGNRTRRDAAGWYVLPFQGEGLTIFLPICYPYGTTYW